MMTNRSVPVLHPGRAALACFALTLALLALLLLTGCGGFTAHRTAGSLNGVPVIRVQPVPGLEATGVYLISTPRVTEKGRVQWTFRLLVPDWLNLPTWWTHEMCHVALIAQGWRFSTESMCEIVPTSTEEVKR